ncbi:MAG: DEAD/DEAH box helicase [Candidatus Micrarchaeaceae archaeon]
MPSFQTIEEAQRYIAEQEARGFKCRMIGSFEGYTVQCVYRFEGTEPIRSVFQPPKEKVLPPGQSSLTGTETGIKISKQEYLEQTKPPEISLELRRYQRDAVDFAFTHRRSIIEIPTSAGKTLIALALIQRALQVDPNGTILVIVPTTALVSQWLDVFRQAGVYATSVTGEEKAWAQYTVTTYQSAIRNIDRTASYSIIIFDETHHLFAPEFVQSLYAILRSPYHRFLIGLTATVREYGEAKMLQNRYFPDVFSMTIEEYRRTGFVPPIEVYYRRVVFSSKDMDEYQEYTKKINNAIRYFGTGDYDVWLRYASGDPSKESTIIARSAIKARADRNRLLIENPEKMEVALGIVRENPEPTVIFVDLVDVMNKLSSYLRANGISSAVVSEETPSDERIRIFRGIQDGTIRVLVGGSAISEGLNLPDLSNAILYDLYVRGRRLYVQRIGRIIRYKPGKKAKLFVLYVAGTIEEENLSTIQREIGEAIREVS